MIVSGDQIRCGKKNRKNEREMFHLFYTFWWFSRQPPIYNRNIASATRTPSARLSLQSTGEKTISSERARESQRERKKITSSGGEDSRLFRPPLLEGLEAEHTVVRLEYNTPMT